MLNDELHPPTGRRRTVIAGMAAAAIALSGIAATAAPAAAAAEVATFTVAPDGDDAAAGSAAAPFRTIERAQEAVRTVNDDMSGDIRVVLRGGTYPVAQTIEFTPDDSGTNGHRVIWSAAPGERPVLDAGTPVTGWSQHDGDIWKAPLARDAKLRALYVDGERATMASTTVEAVGCDGTFTVAAGQAPWAAESGSQCDGVTYAAADVPEITGNAADIEIESATTWTTALVGVREVATSADGEQRILRLQQPGAAIAMGAFNGNFDTSGTHTISNAYAFLDTPGEFFFDRKDQTVYYMKGDSTDLASATVVAPDQLESLLSIAGTSTAERVQNLAFEGLTLQHSDWNLAQIEGSTYKQAQQANLVNSQYVKGNFHSYHYRNVDLAPSAVEVASASGISFTRNTVQHTGADGISLMNDVVDAELVGNATEDIGGTAVNIGHPQHVYIGDGTPENGEKYAPGVEGAPTGVRLADNVLTRNGALFPGSSAIAAYFAVELTVERNRIEQTPWNGISLGWGWKDFDGEEDSVEPGNPTDVARDNTVRGNAFYDVMGRLSDSGAMYTLGSQPGSTFTGNYVQGIREGKTYGIHPDEGTAFIEWDDNVLNIPQGVQNPIHSGNWGRQHDITITDTWGPNNKMFEQNVVDSRIDNIKVYTDSIWPAEAYAVALDSGPQAEFWDLLSAGTARPDHVLPAGVRVDAATASIPIRSAGDGAATVWLAPEGTTVFETGPTMTSAAGTAESIDVPQRAGLYRAFVVAADGGASASSEGVVWRMDPAPVDAAIIGAGANKCVQAEEGAPNAVLADCTGSESQQFTAGEQRELVVGDACYAAVGGGLTAGTVTALEDCDGSPSQQWELMSNGNIVNLASSLCIDAFGAGNANGATVGLWNCSDAINQVWRVQSPQPPEPAATEVEATAPGSWSLDEERTIAVTVTSAAGTAPGGSISVWEGGRELVADTELGEGTADVQLRGARIGLGEHGLDIRYSGDEDHAPSAVGLDVTITAGPSTTPGGADGSAGAGSGSDAPGSGGSVPVGTNAAGVGGNLPDTGAAIGAVAALLALLLLTAGGALLVARRRASVED